MKNIFYAIMAGLVVAVASIFMQASNPDILGVLSFGIVYNILYLDEDNGEGTNIGPSLV